MQTRLGQPRTREGALPLVAAAPSLMIAPAGDTMNDSVLSPPSPCGESNPHAGRSWGTVRTAVATRIRASRDEVFGLFLDYRGWPRIFSETILGVELAARGTSTTAVRVNHREDGPVLNVLTACPPNVIVLEEFKPRYHAVFVNRFDHAFGGMRYSVEARVHVKQPFTLLAPFLSGRVEQALRRFTLHPVRRAAEREFRR